MDQDRQEVYERIPWESLEKRGGDRQWLVYVLAGAVTLGALAYSFVRNQPTAPPPVEAVDSTAPATPTTVVSAATTPTTMASPVVVAEADLFAVDPERLIDQAAAHAEWFAVEYVSFDGSEQSRQILSSLLPEEMPLPEAPDGTQVFVDWAGARSVTQTGPTTFEVEVLVRSLSSSGDAGFTRQPPLLLTMSVETTDDGRPRVTTMPTLSTAAVAPAAGLTLAPVPDEVIAGIEAGGDGVIGGVQQADGTWQVVVMVPGADGVSRPVTIEP